MNFEYRDYYNSEKRKNIKITYLNSFPKEERFPFWILKHSIKHKKGSLCEILNCNKFIGMYYVVKCQDSFYLMYFAIDKLMRNKGYGSKVLEDLKLKYGKIFLSIEKSNDEISIKRKNFYLRNGFYETNQFYEDNGVIYELLCTDKDFVINEEILKSRYSNMTDSKIIKKIIGNIFNMDNIKFLN